MERVEGSRNHFISQEDGGCYDPQRGLTTWERAGGKTACVVNLFGRHHTSTNAFCPLQVLIQININFSPLDRLDPPQIQQSFSIQYARPVL